MVHDVLHVTPAGTQIFTNAVKDNDGIVNRVTRDGEEGTDMNQGELLAGENHDAEADQDVVEESGKGSQGKREFEADGNVDKNSYKPDN